MTTIDISDDAYRRVVEFKAVVEAAINEELDLRTYLEVILQQGINSMLADLIGQDPAILIKSFQQLASKHPAEIYQFVAQTIREGILVGDREELRRRIGFSPRPHQNGG
jgi:hypothetical protein